MIKRAAAAASLRSRRKKMRLFHELIQPTAETTVVDVGVADAPFGEGEGQALTHNFFEALYPWPERITAVGNVPLENFARAFPQIPRVVADGRDLPFADGEFDVAFSNAVVEHVGGRDDQERFVARALPGLEAGLRHDAEPPLPRRPAHPAPVPALAPRRPPPGSARRHPPALVA